MIRVAEQGNPIVKKCFVEFIYAWWLQGLVLLYWRSC